MAIRQFSNPPRSGISNSGTRIFFEYLISRPRTQCPSALGRRTTWWPSRTEQPAKVRTQIDGIERKVPFSDTAGSWSLSSGIAQRNLSGQRVLRQADELRCHFENKPWVVIEISLPETPGFLAQAMKPLQARFFYPVGSVLHTAGGHIERRTHSDHHPGIELRQALGHEVLLLGRTETDPEYVR